VPSANVFEAAPNTQLKQLLAREKDIHAKAEIVTSLHDMFQFSKIVSE